ncbi:MAG TPA: hypothetical protein VM204_04095 [Gaiellaceae bacterium]|nr:hypothetical protein [Gaiellaceae bacterium]
MAALDPKDLTTYAREIARAFGLDLEVEAPRDERGREALVRGLRAALDPVRPVASAPAIGEVLAALSECAGASSAPRRVRRHLGELDELVAAGTYARTKRAERGRVFALLLLVFGLTSLAGVDAGAQDPETTLKLVRRARR